MAIDIIEKIFNMKHKYYQETNKRAKYLYLGHEEYCELMDHPDIMQVARLEKRPYIFYRMEIVSVGKKNHLGIGE